MTETSYRYDEFPLTPSRRPSAVLDPTRAGTPRGNVTTIVERVSATRSVSTETRYFDSGATHTVRDPKGGVTTHAPDFSLCGPASTLKSSVRNPLGHLVSTVTDCASGVVLQTTDANGRSKYTQYDFLARPVETADPGDVLTALPQSGPAAFTRLATAPTAPGTRPGHAQVSNWTEYLSLGLRGQQRVVNYTRDGSASGLYVKTFTDGRSQVADSARESVHELMGEQNRTVVGRAIHVPGVSITVTFKDVSVP
ncbi:MAG TPA: hypothetical protein VEK79_01605 [Thermoanaerobaculia bacterium]|nr:hypothetical protein [Thermoanaerobaculia bacterium]